jgi:hypothetical protein
MFFSGLSYLQQITDLNSLEEIHVESGQWVNLPETNPPTGNARLVRQATILHGDILLAQGPVPPQDPVPNNLAPNIGATSFLPTFVASGQPLTDPASQALLSSTTLPPGVPQSFITDPNQVLKDANQGVTFINTDTLQVTADSSAIVNIPFVKTNANVTSFEATFWIETIPQSRNSIMDTFMRLQYSQKVNLEFDGINWPHISVATLIKQ